MLEETVHFVPISNC